MIKVRYRFTPFYKLLEHSVFPISLLRDTADRNQVPEGQVPTGDYLITVATNIDRLSQELPEISKSEVIIIQGFINDLLYVQCHYNLVSKR